jgi:hypothetical protein
MDRGVAPWLLSAARFERDVVGDLHAAEQHLALAVQRAPRHRAALDAFREVAQQLSAGRRTSWLKPAPELAERYEAAEARPRKPEFEPAEPDLAEEDPELVERAATLESALRLDPSNAAAAVDLAAALIGLGRDNELVALISARLEDGDQAELARLAPLAGPVFERLEAQARPVRPQEADLYAQMRERLLRQL